MSLQEKLRAPFEQTSPVFDPKTLRLVIGLVAFCLPYLVTLVAEQSLSSISWSYFTGARDWFVGLLFVVGGMMFAYNGHTRIEAIGAKVGAVCAVLLAIFPTSEDCCAACSGPSVHGVAAIGLFLILTWFCFGPFRETTKGQGGKKELRAKIYFFCGTVMALALVVGAVGTVALDCDQLRESELIYWVELVALNAFGFAWFTAGKVFSLLADDDERLRLF